jgi:hypothetical protein
VNEAVNVGAVAASVPAPGITWRSGRQDCRTWVRAAVVALVSLGVLPDAALPMVDAMGP